MANCFWGHRYGSASHSNFRTHANCKRHSSCVGYTKNNSPKATAFYTLHVSIAVQMPPMLQLGEPQLHINFANEFLIWYDSDNDWPLRILWTDEVYFNLNGNVNTKNCVHWADMNSHTVAPVSLFTTKVTVYWSISGTVLLCPYFFEEATPMGFVTRSVTASSYTAMLQKYVVPELL